MRADRIEVRVNGNLTEVLSPGQVNGRIDLRRLLAEVGVEANGVRVRRAVGATRMAVSAGIKQHQFSRFWRCQDRRWRPAGTRRRQPHSPKMVNADLESGSFFPAGRVNPQATLPRRQQEPDR